MKLRILLFFTLLAAVAGCERPTTSSGDRPVVVATTTMLGDMVRELGGNAVDARSIMKPGGDPHLYQPTPADARMIASSQLVVTSGLHLEGWIDDLVRNAGGGDRAVVVASRSIEPIKMADSPGGVDPHFWFDLKAWNVAVDNVSAQLQQVVPESERENLRDRTAAYKATIERLDGWTRAQLESIPKAQRVLVTSHDAFNYFGRAYDLDVVAIQGISTEQEASQRDVANVIDIVRDRKAPAVFVETSVNPQLLEQVARETGAKLAGPLYSDSLGPKGSRAESFIGTYVENVRQITDALGGEATEFDPRPTKAEK